jgi:hypothetical protein
MPREEELADENAPLEHIVVTEEIANTETEPETADIPSSVSDRDAEPPTANEHEPEVAPAIEIAPEVDSMSGTELITDEVSATDAEPAIDADLPIEIEPESEAELEIEAEQAIEPEPVTTPEAIIDEEPPTEELSVEEVAAAEHQLDELLALLDMSTESSDVEAVGEEAAREQSPVVSQEIREALDETLPSFEPEKIPELRAPAQRPMEPSPADRDASPERGRSLSLAIHSRMNVTRLRSSNLRLIPGLEFAPLRHEDQQRRQSIAPLIDETVPELDLPDRLSRTGDAPPLPTFGPYPPMLSVASGDDTDLLENDLPATGTFSIEAIPPLPRSFHNRPEPHEGETLTPLEELARRLEKARIPVVEEAEPRHAFEPSIVSDTFASILVAQGAYAEALKAYQTLARTKPERYDHYQQLIRDMQERILNEEDRDELEDSYEPE